MARYEFVEGSSAKFWQIVLEGASFTVTWGRIGTPGTAQTKDFASPGKAQAEHDKLVAEKTKKGYALVADGAAGEAAPAPKPAAKAPTPKPPAPEPTPVAGPVAEPPAAAKAEAPKADRAAPAATGAVTWTEEARAGAAIRRGGARVAPPLTGGIAERFAVMKERFGKVRKSWAFAKFPKDTRPEADRAVAWLDADAPGPLDVQTQAFVAMLTGAAGSEGAYRGAWYVEHMKGVRAAFELWALAEGPAFVARVLLAVTPYAHVMAFADLQNRADLKPVIALRGGDDEPVLAQNGWAVLREVLSTCSDEAYAAARAVVAEAWPKADFRVREQILDAFRDETAWADEQAERWLALRETEERAPHLDLFRKRRVDLTLQVFDLMVRKHGHRNLLRDRAFDLLDLYGAEAEGVLQMGIETSEWDDTVKSAAEALACIASPGVAKTFAGLLMDRVLKGIAAAWTTEHPALAVPALAQVVAGRGQASDAAGALLLAIDRAHAGLVDGALPELTPAARAAVGALRERMRVLPEASPAELPAVLVAPPWAAKKRRAAPTVVDIAPLARPETIVWAPRERERALKAGGTWGTRTVDFAAMNARVLAGQASDGHGYRGQAMYHLAGVSDADALAAWNSWPADEFRYPGYGGYGTMLARVGLDGLPGFFKNASVASVACAEALVRVDSPRVAATMAHGLGGKSLRKHAERWLLAFPETAAVGLIPIAVGPLGKGRQQAEEALRWLAIKGHRSTIEAVAAQYGPQVAPVVTDALDVDPRELVPAKMPKLPSFWDPTTLPRPALRGRERSLPLSAVENLALMLAISPLDQPYVGLADVVEACDPASLEAFAWALFQAWLLSGASPKDIWCFHAVGHLGGDESARRLTPLVRAWPGEKAQARAVVGLDVLARIGTDVALMHLHGIAQKLRFKVLQEKASEKIDEIAANRGLTSHELADRLVPDLDLDDDGSRTLDFGPRQFRVGFDEELAPFVKDAAGKPVKDLPKPAASDDAEKAKAAVEAWKTLKKDAKAVASSQITRLELAMCLRRRWEAAAFRTFLLGHPLVGHVVRRLVWGVYEGDRLVGSFRAAEDGTLADPNDDPYALPDEATVGIPHAIELSDELAAAWGQVFADYRILQPFPQLGRDTYRPADAEARATTLTRVVGAKVKTGKILGLDVRGWRKGPPQDSGGIWTYDKPILPGVHAELRLTPGLAAEMSWTEPEQELGELDLHSTDEDVKVPALGSLDPVLFSELVRDVLSLRG